MPDPHPLYHADFHCLEDTALDLSRSVVLPQHLWVGSGRGVVAPLDTTLGVGGFHAPPVSAPAFTLRLELRVNGIQVLDTPGGFRLPEPENNIPTDRRALLQRRRQCQWDRIIRVGHVHTITNAGLLSFEITSELLPLVGEQGGFAMRLMVHNHGPQALDVNIFDTIDPGAFGRLDWSQWVWQLPKPTTAGQCVGERRFRAGEVDLQLDWDRMQFHVPVGGEATTAVRTVVLPAAAPCPAAPRAAMLVQQCIDHQSQRLHDIGERLPTLATNHEPLRDYWRRCLITGMTCLWEHESFACRPHVATSGIDGGSLCTYLWDVSYAPLVLHLLEPRALPAILNVLRKVDLENHFAFTPDGAGTGPWYAANDYSLTELVWTYAGVCGVDRELVRFLQQTLDQSEQRLPGHGDLKDFGNNRNLLEMRTNGYEHMVPCFNSLRARNLDRLATLLDLAGLGGSDRWRQRGRAVAREVRHRLWNAKTQWFDCLHPDGSRHHVDSIQIFDVMLAGVASRQQQRCLAERVVDGDFLDTYGVHSVSPRDARHFELVDVDWSGNGAFIGEPPLLAYTLWKCGFPGHAWRLMQRLFWMGSMLPYLPQEAYARKPSASTRGLANICAALAGVRAVLSGMLGVELVPDGTLTIEPRLPRGLQIELRRLRLGNVEVDLLVGKRCIELRVNGTEQPSISPTHPRWTIATRTPSA